MNFRLVLGNLGKLITLYMIIMVIPLGLAIWNGESSIKAWSSSIITLGLIGIPAMQLARLARSEDKRMNAKESIAFVSLAWILSSLLGALPFWFADVVPTYIDAVFETVSGLTTTGASVISNVEALPLSLILWRSLTHWLGGLGIIVLFIIIIPNRGMGAVYLFNAEVPGPTNERVLPRIRDTALTLWIIYFVFTTVLTLLLWIAGMNLFDAVNHSMATIATGGFSTKNTSMMFYDNFGIEVILTIFMILSGANFGLYLVAWRTKSFKTFRNSEFKVYLLIIFIATVLIAGSLWLSDGKTLSYGFRHASFQVATIITTTGYASTDFDQWPSMSKLILLLLMFIGGSAGSTSGGMKVSRLMLLAKSIWAELKKGVHSHAVSSIKLEGKPIDPLILNRVSIFFFLYISTFALASILIAFTGLEPFDAISAVAATLGNVGPGFGVVGPTTSFAGVSLFGKSVLITCMLLGRLEFFTLLTLLRPEFWKSKKAW